MQETKTQVPKKRQNRGGLPRPQKYQTRAISLFKENILSGGSKSIETILLEAGYAPASAKQVSNIMAGIRPHLDPFVARMEKLRERVLDRMENQIERADFGDATRAMHTLTHNIRLLSGKSTQNLGVIVDDKRAEIDRLIDE